MSTPAEQLTPIEFRAFLTDLEQFFGRPGERQAEIMFNVFKRYPYAQMKAAVTWLIEHHERKQFPLPSDFFEALRELATVETPTEKLPDTAEEAGEARCDVCRGVGMMVEHRTTGEYRHGVAVYCDCNAGRRRRAGHIAYMKRHHSGHKIAAQHGETD